MNLDARIRRALQPLDPPDDFARRVRQRVETGLTAAPVTVASVRRAPRWRSWLATAAAAAGIAAGTYGYQQYEQRREVMMARAQVLLALQIASRELNVVHRVVVRESPEPDSRAGTSPDGDRQ